MNHLLNNAFCTILTVSIASLLILSSSTPAVAAKTTASLASSCPGIQVHRLGAPGKGVVHYQRNDCGQVEFSAFERSTVGDAKAITAGDRGVMIGKPAYNRRHVNK